MSKFTSREEFEEWAFEQFIKYGIKQPDTYSEEALELTQEDDIESEIVTK